MTEAPRYFRPVELAQALTLAGQSPLRLLAGGTDFYPSKGERPVQEDILDVSAIPGMTEIRLQSGPQGEVLRLGAMVTWSQVLAAPELSGPGALALRQCAREVGARQIQNRATLVGNLCNASPAADGIPVLIALGAQVEVVSARGLRCLPVEDFVLGPRATALAAGEIVTALLLPAAALSQGRSLFLKLGSRRYLVISMAMLAAHWTYAARDAQGARVASGCRITVGACSPVARRLLPLEQWCLAGMRAETRAAALAASLALLSPIDDVRADREYRLQLVHSLLDKLQLEMQASRA